MKDPPVVPDAGGPPGSTAGSLLNGVRGRDPAAWERLTTLYGPVVYGWARRAGLGAEDAADVVQDVFRSVLARVADFRHRRPGDSFRGWLWTVTRNKARDHWRRAADRPAAAGGTDAHRRLLAVPAEADLSGSAVAPASSGVVRRAAEVVREEFEERTWKAFWAAAVDGRPAADVAADLGMTANAVYVARSRILRRLREVLSDDG